MHRQSGMMKFITLELISVQLVSKDNYKNSAGQQYTYEGNIYKATTSKGNAVEECLTQTIANQEQGKCPIEYTNGISRAKVYDMKNLKVIDNVRTYTALY